VNVMSKSVPRVNINFSDPDNCKNPWPKVEEVRALGPVVFNEFLDAWMVTGYRDCARVLANAHNFSTEKLAETYGNMFGGSTMQVDDTSRHHMIKAVWAKHLQRDSMPPLEPMVRDLVDWRLLPFMERIRAGETVEARKYLTRGIPTLVIATLLGIPRERFEEFGEWSDNMSGILVITTDPTAVGSETHRFGQEATAKMNAYVREVIQERRRKPGDDLVSAMVHSDIAKTQMSDQDIMASVTQLVFGGNETTANLMTMTLQVLAEHPDQRRMLAQDRSLIPAAIEEIIRWSSPVTVKFRAARNGNPEVAGVPIPDGRNVIPLLISANRDPANWDNPTKFDVKRPFKPHLGFGFGHHICLGINLARFEMQVWLNRLLDELPEWDVIGDIDYGRNFFLRGPQSIMLRAC